MLFLLACATAPDTEKQAPGADDPPALSVAHADSVTDLGAEAVAAAPAWLQQDLALSLRQLDTTLQDEYAGVILDLDDAYLTDEVAFTIAHLSPEVLSNTNFYPQLIVENAQLVYARDADLAYVTIDDVGEPGVDADYYSTTTYRVGLEDGSVEERTIPRDIYYWYLVHPRMEDETPFYVDPLGECMNYGTQCPVSPEEGVFWRQFLWNGTEAICPEGETCTSLSTVMTANTLWNSKAYSADDNGAVGQIIRWLQSEMVFGAHDERSVQPVRIYELGRGNCGEWADMTTSASRTALIPSMNVGAFVNDHTWNEFYDGGWQQWEPVNTYVEHWYYYQDTEEQTPEGGSVFAVQANRGDASMWNVTEDYGNTFDLTVHVADADGNPVDGAIVSAWGPLWVYSSDEYYPAIEAATDVNGNVTMPLGEQRPFKVRVDAEVGKTKKNALEDVTDGVFAGETVEHTSSIRGSMPAALALTAVDAAGGETLAWELAIDGFRTVAKSYFRGQTFSLEAAAGKVHAFLVDEANYQHFLDGDPFDAVDGGAVITAGAHPGTAAFDPTEAHYLVITNTEVSSTVALGRVSASVGSASVDQTFQLLPGEFVAILVE